MTSLLAIIICLIGSPAVAQDVSTSAARAKSPNWTLDTTMPKAAPSRKRSAGVPPADAGKAARLDEARRKFFESQGEEPKPAPPADFGGYDASTMSGTMRPGAAFKF